MSVHNLSGLTAWLVQRLSAVYMGLFVVALVILFATSPAYDYTAWHALLSQPLVTIVTTMFFLALLLHAWVGIRDVILDYAGQSPSMRLLLLTLLGGWLIALGLWVMRIMIKVMI